MGLLNLSGSRYGVSWAPKQPAVPNLPPALVTEQTVEDLHIVAAKCQPRQISHLFDSYPSPAYGGRRNREVAFLLWIPQGLLRL